MGAPHQLLVLCVLLSLSEAGAQDSTNCALWCPKTSTCLNSSACHCNPGFGPAKIITSPTENCDDINECIPPISMACGEFADCKNTEGSYQCVCSPGYVLTSGNTVFSKAEENDCHIPAVAQTTPATPVSTVPGNLPDFPATVDPGTQSGCSGGRTEDGSQWTKNRKVCQGIVNDSGDCISVCPPGHKLTPEGPRRCTDVNECTCGQNPCHVSAHCLNTVGSYMCKCRRGWKPVPGSPNGPSNTVCEGLQLRCHKPRVAGPTVRIPT